MGVRVGLSQEQFQRVMAVVATQRAVSKSFTMAIVREELVLAGFTEESLQDFNQIVCRVAGDVLAELTANGKLTSFGAISDFYLVEGHL